MPSFFSAAVRARSDEKNSVRAMKVVTSSAKRGYCVAGRQPLAHDDVRLEQLHHGQGQSVVVMPERRHEAGLQLGPASMSARYS